MTTAMIPTVPANGLEMAENGGESATDLLKNDRGNSIQVVSITFSVSYSKN